MIWFLIGAGLGVLQMVISLIRRPVTGGHPIQGLVTAAVLGALVWGTLLWLVSTFIFRW